MIRLKNGLNGNKNIKIGYDVDNHADKQQKKIAV